MSIFDRFRTRKEQRTILPERPGTVYFPLLFQGEKNPTVSICVDKIVSTLSVLTPTLMSHSKGNGKKLAVNHPLFRVLENPTVEETPSLFYNNVIRHILLEGNAYIYLSRSNGEIVSFSLIDPKQVRVDRDANFRKIFYVGGVPYTEKQILHIPYPGSGYNGTIGISPVQLHRDLIDLDNKLLSYIGHYFDNSVGERLAITLGDSYPTKTQEMDKLYAAITPVINKYVVGSKNAGKPMIMLPDSNITKLEQSSNVQAELSSLLTMVEKQIASAFGVPYEVIDSSQQKYASLEVEQIAFIQSAIQPLGDHICSSFEKLLDPSDTNLFIQYDYKRLLRASTKETIDYLAKEIQSGLLTINEARSKLGYDSIGEAGDYYYLPSNIAPVSMENIQAYMAQSKLALKELDNAQPEKTEQEVKEEHGPQGDDKL